MKENDSDGLNSFLDDHNDSKEDKFNIQESLLEQNQTEIDKSLMNKIKANKQLLNIGEMDKIIEQCLEANAEDPNANIIDENFLRLVWSICKMNKIYNKESDGDNRINYILSQIRQNFAYEFLLCCYKLDLSIKNLHPSSYLYELCRDSALYGDSLIKIAFLNEKKPINIKFLYWLEENKYFDKFYCAIELENFIKKRTEQNIGNYEFDSYDEFNQFIGKKKKEEEKEKEKKNEKYEGASVYVTELLKVLKKENKFLEPAELERLAKKEYKDAEGMQGYFYSRICFKNPKDLTKDDLDGWTKQDAEYVNKTGITAPNELGLRRHARKKYWEYIKCIFFGNTKKHIRGLFDIKKLNSENLNQILKIILSRSRNDDSGDYSFLEIQGVADEEDIFSSGTSTRLCDDIKKFRDQCLSEENSKYRIISGGILLAIGIIGCGVILGIGLTSKLVIALFLFSVTTAVVGIVCLLWGKISSCLSVCTPFNGSGLSEKDETGKNDQFPDMDYSLEDENKDIMP